MSNRCVVVGCVRNHFGVIGCVSNRKKEGCEETPTQVVPSCSGVLAKPNNPNSQLVGVSNV